MDRMNSGQGQTSVPVSGKEKTAYQVIFSAFAALSAFGAAYCYFSNSYYGENWVPIVMVVTTVISLIGLYAVSATKTQNETTSQGAGAAQGYISSYKPEPAAQPVNVVPDIPHIPEKPVVDTVWNPTEVSVRIGSLGNEIGNLQKQYQQITSMISSFYASQPAEAQARLLQMDTVVRILVANYNQAKQMFDVILYSEPDAGSTMKLNSTLNKAEQLVRTINGISRDLQTALSSPTALNVTTVRSEFDELEKLSNEQTPYMRMRQ